MDRYVKVICINHWIVEWHNKCFSLQRKKDSGGTWPFSQINMSQILRILSFITWLSSNWMAYILASNANMLILVLRAHTNLLQRKNYSDDTKPPHYSNYVFIVGSCILKWDEHKLLWIIVSAKCCKCSVVNINNSPSVLESVVMTVLACITPVSMLALVEPL